MRIVPLVLVSTLAIGIGSACQTAPGGEGEPATAPARGAYGGPRITAELYAMNAEPPLFQAIVRMTTPPAGYTLSLDASSLKDGIATLRVTVEQPAPGTPASLTLVEHQVAHPLGPVRPSEVRVMVRLVTGGKAPAEPAYVLAATAD